MLKLKQTEVDDDDGNKVSGKLLSSVKVGSALWNTDNEDAEKTVVDKTCHQMIPPPAAHGDDPVPMPAADRKAIAKLLEKTMPARFAEWRKKLYASSKPPTPEQWRILEEIYQRTWKEQEGCALAAKVKS